MPTLPQFTAEGRPGITSTPMTSPDSFGAQAGVGMQALGQSFQIIDKKLKDQRDKIELSRMASEYAIGSDALKAKVLQEPDYTKHAAMFQEGEQQLREKIADTSPSKDVSTAFEAHSNITYGTNQVHLAGESRRIEAEKQLVDYQTEAESIVDRAALAPTYEEADNILAVQEDLTSSMVSNGLLTPAKAQLAREQYSDRFWTVMARRNPTEILKLYNSRTPVKGMDDAKMGNYLNIAISEMGRIDKQQNAAVKELQDKTYAKYQADAMYGNLDLGALHESVRSREIDADKARPIIELNDKMIGRKNEANLVPGRSAQIETLLRGVKFSPSTDDETLQKYSDRIQQQFMAGYISKDDYQHLMGIWQGASDWLHSENRSNQNQAVSHAHEYMRQALQVTGLMQFDSLGNQAQADASLHFYRQVEGDPAHAMDIAERVVKLYKPVIEQRIKLSESDQHRLDDARMQGLLERKAISPAAYKAWKDAREQQKGQKIVDDTLLSLPLPQEPTWFDTIKDKFTGSGTTAKRERK